MKDLEHFYFNKQEPIKSCLLAMRDILINFDQDITETRKYGMPCFCYRGKMFCYIWIDRKTDEPYFLMVEGKHLHHPTLETGNRSRMKIFRIKPKKDLPVHLIETVLNDALNLYKSGVIIIK